MTGQNAEHEVKAIHDLFMQPVARRSCSVAGLKALQSRKLVFVNLMKGLTTTRRELENAYEWADFYNAGLMYLRWTKAGCDAFLSMTAAALGEKNKAAQAVLHGYKLSATLADAGSRAASGSKVESALVLRDVKDAALGLAGERTGPASGIMNVYVNIGIDAYRGDQKGVIKGAMLDQTVEKSKLMLDLVTETEKIDKGKTFAAPRVKYGLGLVTTIASAGRAFGDELEKAGDDYLSERESIAKRRRAMRRTLSMQVATLETKIEKLKAKIDSCFVVAPQIKR